MGQAEKGQAWDAKHYDDRIGFVSRLGKGLIELLKPEQGERIIDLGCGTGDLAHEISHAGTTCVGLDYSEDMIKAARSKFPGLSFRVADAEQFRLEAGEQPYDAVFSNAALHWMLKPQEVISSVWQALRPGGRFVAEFGGSGNVGTIIAALTSQLELARVDWRARFPWYFPTVGEYAPLLEKQGFEVRYAELYDRPTPLGSGDEGMRNWLRAFAGPLLQGFREEERNAIITRCVNDLAPHLFRDGEWIADYRRIRIAAVKR
ncbi:trans-aconitate 2-methyltransferase [Paenibacillus sp. PAMC21692]|uniref:class I SAM-dependent methyltransferase n=1 Tax=Paenibacillus sp. PAMC21692 TaxID=2762320 RepID=UPI00164DD1F2|nr:class I SAM-dependent methyltransferase [Paenibacillus sp. PAMC21692]QNK58917.1 methyltransferase domain-containing protein [Paenibacillus sp. PAMC21692]